MASHSAIPEAFANLVDLCSDLTGAFVLYATDDYFAEKENLLKPNPAEWIEGKYTDKGKWMDGWESQRKREPGHDFAIVRLGMPGSITGFVADTTHFKGNAPQEVSLEGIDAAQTATAKDLVDHPGWFELCPRTAVKPDFQNVLTLPAPSARVSHVRLRIFPDGGVARLRIYGAVLPDERTFWRPGSIDLVAIENGGTVSAVSDQFFGPPSNLTLPGRGVNMGDGWETKRRRTPGSDWCVLKLARRGVIDRIEIDTHFFKGNAPQATLIECLDETTLQPGELESLMRAPKGWKTLVEKTPLVQHRKHPLEPARAMPVTHIRVHIFPHGGVNRMRVFGTALDTVGEKAALDKLNYQTATDAQTTYLSFNGAKGFASKMAALRPFTSVRDVFAKAEEAWWTLDSKDWLEAYAAHPRIGQPKPTSTQTEQSGNWSKGEQKGVEGAPSSVADRLSELNQQYYEKFGFIFICFATGRTAVQMLELLEERFANDKAAEIENAAREQARITRLRIGKWLKLNGA